MPIFLQLQDYQTAVLGRLHLLKVLHCQVEETHDKQLDGQSVGYKDAVLREVIFGKIPEKASQQVVHTVIHIRARLTAWNAVVERTVFTSLTAYLGKVLRASQVTPFLLSQPRFLVIVELASGESRNHPSKVERARQKGDT